MVAHGFKGGVGTASRRVSGRYTVGALVQANYGSREELTIAGVPVGKEITDLRRRPGSEAPFREREGSIIAVIATDAPLLPHQLERLAKRVPMGIARVGGTAANGSGDIFIAFSTANAEVAKATQDPVDIRMLPNGSLSPFFVATIEAVEEAIVNALIAAETMTGYSGNTVFALPHDRLQQVLRKYGRLRLIAR